MEKKLAKNGIRGEKITNIRYVAGEGAHPTQLTVPIITGKVKLESKFFLKMKVFRKFKTFLEI